MFRKSDIRKITIAFDKAFYHEVYLALGKAGLIHLARFSEKDAGADTGLQSEESVTREIIAATSYALNALRLEPDTESPDVRLRNTDEDEKKASGIRKKLEHAARLIGRIREKEETLARDIQYAEALERLGIDASILHKSRIIRTVFGTVENADWIVPSYERFLISRAGHFVFGLSLPAFAADMLQFLKEKGFTEKSNEVPIHPAASLQKRAGELQRRRNAVDAYTSRLKEEKGPVIRQLNADYRAYEDLLKAMRMSVLSARAMFITGWMDTSERSKLLDIMQNICGGKFIIHEQKDPYA